MSKKTLVPYSVTYIVFCYMPCVMFLTGIDDKNILTFFIDWVSYLLVDRIRLGFVFACRRDSSLKDIYTRVSKKQIQYPLLSLQKLRTCFGVLKERHIIEVTCRL